MITSVTLTCPICKIQFEKELRQYNQSIKRGHNCYCSINCRKKSKTNNSIYYCAQCNKEVIRKKSTARSKNIFCTQSCAASYNNSHKTHGNRISKLEKWLQIKLVELYPNLEFIFNGKEAINSELDIYIPSLKLAFELNGIFHYEPIYGEEKLQSIQNNDSRKFQACIERDISLCIIDTSTQKYVKQSTSQKFLDIIIKVISGESSS